MPFVPALGAGVLGALGTMGPVTLGAATTAGYTTLGLGAAAIGGTAYGISSAVSGAEQAKNERKRAAEQEATMRGSMATSTLPATPTPEASQISSAEKLARQRKMALLSGGKTLLTTNTPKINQTGGKTLLGS